MGVLRKAVDARRRTVGAFVVTLLAAGLCVTVPAAAGARPAAAAAPSRYVTLSPRLAVLAEGTHFASRLAQARGLSVPASGVGSLVQRPDGRLLVEIRTRSTSASSVAELRALGAQIVKVSETYATVTAAVLPGALRAIAADPMVRYVNEVLAPHIGRAAGAHATNAATPAVCAPMVSEGDGLMNVAAARAASHVDGSGETVGILSDSFDTDSGAQTHAAGDVASGELPGPGNPCGYTSPVTVQSEDASFGTTDEGRAMAQLVHDLAPGARLAFATADNGIFDFAQQITDLRTQNHANVLVDDEFYLDEPFFQDGPIANAAKAAIAAGVPYFSTAGNSNAIVGGKNVSSYEAPAYRPTPCPVPLGETVLDCHNFDTTGTVPSDQITLPPGGGFSLDLQWAEPWGAVATDFDVFVVSAGGTVLAKSQTRNSASGTPFEFLDYGNSTGSTQNVRIVIARFSGAATPRLKFVFVDSLVSAVQFDTSHDGDLVGPTIFGHNGAAGVGTTAAIPFDNSNTSEDYSSRGPETHYFEPTPSTAPLASPEVLAKPDFAATDGVKTSFLGDNVGGAFRFYGTSAAAPQAAAIGALLIAKDAQLSPAQVVTTLHDTARAVMTNGTADAVGGGYLDATAALGSVTATAGAPEAVSATAGDGRATIQWSAPRTDGGLAITGYTITPYIAGIAQMPQDYNSTATTEVASGLNNGSTYAFQVSARNADGLGVSSDPTASITVGAPAAPTGVAVTAGGNARATLKWVAPTVKNGATITGYVIAPFVEAVAQPQQHVPLGTTGIATGLTNGTYYTFKVAAASNRGTGPFSSATAPIAIGLPGRPINLAVVPANGGAVITYTAAPANGSPITHYGIDVYDGSNLVQSTLFGSATTQSVVGLVNGRTYRVKVAATNDAGVGPKSALSPPVIAGTPGVPIAPRATPGNRRAIVRWTAPNNNGAIITRYVIIPYLHGVGQQARICRSAATTEIITGLTNAKAYAFAVHAINARGPGLRSTTVPIIVGTPTAPTNVSATPGHRSASVHWRTPSNNGSGVTAYVVTPYVGSTPGTPHVFHSSGTTQTMTGLSTGRLYTFKIAAINARGSGPQSGASDAVTVT